MGEVLLQSFLFGQFVYAKEPAVFQKVVWDPVRSNKKKSDKFISFISSPIFTSKVDLVKHQLQAWHQEEQSELIYLVLF